MKQTLTTKGPVFLQNVTNHRHWQNSGRNQVETRIKKFDYESRFVFITYINNLKLSLFTNQGKKSFVVINLSFGCVIGRFVFTSNIDLQ